MIEYKNYRIVKNGSGYYFVINKFTGKIGLTTSLKEALEAAGCVK